jgi:hypothetical protein
MVYPLWTYYPRNTRSPQWVAELVDAVAAVESVISTETVKEDRLTSDVVLARLRPGLTDLGYAVESGKTAASKIRRPVLFGENGVPEVSYEIDAFHDEQGVAVEVEAGRGARGNATYRDIIRASLILDARYFALLVPVTYRHQSSGRQIEVHAYADAQGQLSAIYASQRLRLPFDGAS